MPGENVDGAANVEIGQPHVFALASPQETAVIFKVILKQDNVEIE